MENYEIEQHIYDFVAKLHTSIPLYIIALVIVFSLNLFKKDILILI